MKISEFTYGGVQLRYNPETGECWKQWKGVEWALITAGTLNGKYTRLGIRTNTLLLHRLVAEVFLNDGQPLTPQQDVDHIKRADGSHAQDALSNLRIVSRSQNLKNQTIRSDNTSGYKGVSWHKRDGKWKAKITSCGRIKHLGGFSTPEAAALAYDNAAKNLHGEFAKLNFN